MKRGKRQVQPVSEARFRVVLILTALVLLLGILIVLDGPSVMIGMVPLMILLPSLSAPDSFLRAVDGRIPLLRIRIPLLFVVVIAFVGCLVLLRIDQNIPAAALFLVSNLSFFFAMLGETFRNRSL